ncbi:MAG TPA: aspartate carbamoyltransferase catalytic subunit [Candidatus Kapabacteria bacterium]|nr:aspartate carbamoyltransferase catalytic subunit [Candidatus Kapabacteria bacterium]
MAAAQKNIEVKLRSRHLLGTEGLSANEIQSIFAATEQYKKMFSGETRKLSVLQGVTVSTMFFENSTRTRTSFELAARRLGADVVSFVAATSSISKGESVDDTARTIEAMGIDIAVVRHNCAGVPHRLTNVINAAIINAGDGVHEHPTQALLDAFTIQERLGKVKGLNVCIVGDIANSRVARSNIHSLQTLGASVTVCGPRTLLPKEFGKVYGVDVEYDIREGMRKADVVIMLRIQLERQASGMFPTLEEYRKFYGLNRSNLPDNVKLVLHPGPANRGVEISGEIMDSDICTVTQQVTNGVYIRMAVLTALAKKK